MSCPRHDFHVHTKYLGCANATMEVAAVIGECARVGVTALAFTDHLNRLEQAELHRPILEDIRASATGLEVYFGVELNFTGRDEGFVFDEGIKERYGFQFAIGGIHTSYTAEYDIRKIIDIQHRHHLKTCADPLVDVLVHPYWFWKKEFDEQGWPWGEWMYCLPEAYARELGQAARDSGTAIEINATANLTNPDHSEELTRWYVDYLSAVAAEGALFSVGSDAHDIGRLQEVRAAWQVAEQLGLAAERIWRPAGRPVNA